MGFWVFNDLLLFIYFTGGQSGSAPLAMSVPEVYGGLAPPMGYGRIYFSHILYLFHFSIY